MSNPHNRLGRIEKLAPSLEKLESHPGSCILVCIESGRGTLQFYPHELALVLKGAEKGLERRRGSFAQAPDRIGD